MEFKQIVKQRYATKKFDGKTIPQDKITELFEMIRLSASSFNIQPWKIKVITDAETKKKLTPVSWNQPQIESCSHLLIFCADTNVDTNIDKLEQLMLTNGAPANAIQGYLDIMRNFSKNMDSAKKLDWAQHQIYIALGNVLNGAKSLGFDSCPMEGFSPEEYTKILDLPSHLTPTVVCPIGYAADTAKPKLRFPQEEIFF